MACDITSGFVLGCRDNIGGIKAVYILSGSINSVADASDGLIESISGSGAFYKFELPRNVGDFNETPTPSQENGTIYYEQVVNIALHKMQSSTRNQMKVLGQNPNIKIIVETENGSVDGIGKFWYVGQYRGLSLSSGTVATGVAAGDMNGYTLGFTGQEPLPASEISGSLVSVLSGIDLP